MEKKEILIPPGSFDAAAKAHLPTLESSLTKGSGWYQLIKHEDDPKRTNSPYYGPATQFLIDCFLHIVQNNPAIQAAQPTPRKRAEVAKWILENYIRGLAVGPNRIIANAYRASDLARTKSHLKRIFFLERNYRHVLAGAYVPFIDISRVCGGAALVLETSGVPEDEVTETIIKSNQLKIIAGIDGLKTPEVNSLGMPYTDTTNLQRNQDGTVGFTPFSLELIQSLLSGRGCPTGKLADNAGTVFDTYWRDICHYTLDGIDTEQTLLESLDESLGRKQ